VLAARAVKIDPEDTLAGLEIGEAPEPEVPEGWVVVDVKAAALNRHDLWTLQGVGIRAEQLPMVLGCDAAGIDPDGNEVVIHSVIADPDAGDGDETLDPKRSLFSERYQGTMSERMAVPRRNLLPKPASLSWEEAACLPTAWLTAYKMLFSRSGLRPGDTVLIQGAGGGVATALIALARAGGYRVWVTSRTEVKRSKALELGAHAAFETGARLPERVDAVMETVGEATWSHSLKSLRPGGRIVTSGATAGFNPPADLTQVFFLQREIVGSTMGTRGEFRRLLSFCDVAGLKPLVDSVMPLADARDGFARMNEGDIFGKIVFTP
jgi:NADPH:quinone reductase-like Zn-dependent oxidoreductase